METENCNLQTICETLLETYNTSILDRSEKFFKKACIEEAKKCVEQHPHKKNVITNKDGDVIGETSGLERRVLSQLILNHSNESNPEIPPENKKPIANYIGGPFTLTMHWNKDYKKIIYIFGETHSRKTDCDKFKRKDGFFGKQHTMLIEDYLEQLIRNTDVFIDFYLEIGRDPNFSGDTRISKITERLKHCFYDFKSPDHDEPVYFGPNPKSGFQFSNPFSHDDTIIKCWLSRMHYFDLRRAAPDMKTDDISYLCVKMSTLTYILQDIIDDGGDRSSYPIIIAKFLLDVKYEQNIKPILQNFSEIETIEDYKDFWNKRIYYHTFLSKKVTKVKSRHMHTKIKTFIENEILNTKINENIINPQLFVDLVKQYIETIDKYKVNDTYNFANAPESDITLLAESKCITMFILINTYIADYYLLCRIFREFDLSLDAKSERWTDEPKEPHNIIIYAGNRHSDKVRKFLQKLDFDVIHSTDTSVENCIYMKDFPQPFFSNHPKVKWGDLDDIPMKLRNSII